MSGASDVIGSALPGGAGGAMDMFGDKAPSIGNLGIQSAPVSVAANALGNATGLPLDKLLGMVKGNFSKFDPTKFGANLLMQSLQPTTPASVQTPQQQQPSMLPQQQAPQQMAAPQAPGQGGGMLGGMLNQPMGQSQGGQADILKRLGLLGGMQ